MGEFESTSQSFIVKIWLEETAAEAGRALWRGHITHVPSGERRYLKSLDDVAAFIEPFMARMGIKAGSSWRKPLKRRSQG